MTRFDVQPLTPGRWPDLEAIFEARGCSVARGCWCMYYRVSGKETGFTRPGDAQRERSKAALQAIRPYLTKGSVIGFDELCVSEFPGETAALREVLDLSRHALVRSPHSNHQSYIVF